MSDLMLIPAARLASDRRGVSSLEYAVLCAMMSALALALANQMNGGLVAILERVALLAG